MIPAGPFKQCAMQLFPNFVWPEGLSRGGARVYTLQKIDYAAIKKPSSRLTGETGFESPPCSASKLDKLIGSPGEL